jgi:CubicO group peptidase (beta-lactamase class C family)
VDKYLAYANEFLEKSNSDGVAVAILDFKSNDFKHFELENKKVNKGEGTIYFDLASLTKPLVNGFSYISESISDPKLELLVNHRAGLPAWGLLPKSGWRDQIMAYDIAESKTEYSDFSALRYMLELEKLTGKTAQDICKKNTNDKIVFWKDLKNEHVLQNGFIEKCSNFGKVHDPNAYNLDVFTSHAGLFGTIDGLANSIIDFNQKHDLLGKFKTKSESRFKCGFDTVENTENTLAGNGCSSTTFGHLGFTGTSLWIDPELEVGHLILSNATKLYWFDKKELNILRKKIGSLVWENAKN